MWRLSQNLLKLIFRFLGKNILKWDIKSYFQFVNKTQFTLKGDGKIFFVGSTDCSFISTHSQGYIMWGMQCQLLLAGSFYPGLLMIVLVCCHWLIASLGGHHWLDACVGFAWVAIQFSLCFVNSSNLPVLQLLMYIYYASGQTYIQF